MRTEGCLRTGIQPLKMRTRLVWLAVLLVVLTFACGGGDGGGSGKESSDETDSGAVAEAVSTLQSCLTDAGLEVNVEDTKAFGVEAPHEHLEPRVGQTRLQGRHRLGHCAGLGLIGSFFSGAVTVPASACGGQNDQQHGEPNQPCSHYERLYTSPEAPFGTH